MGRPRFPSSASKLINDIECVSIKDPTWKGQILAKLERFPHSHAVLDYTLDLAETLQAKSVLLEPYISTDWADEYAAWYARIFRDVPRVTWRLHFFAGVGNGARAISKDDLFSLGEICGKDPSPYLGYSVVRPFEPITVNETVLSSPYRNGPIDLVHCLPKFSAHILGHEFRIRGMPFIQQDRAVSRCGQANLWMVARYMNARGEARRYRPNEMTKLANLTFSVGSTREGLIGEQMFMALREIELNPELIHPKAADALQLLATCVDSEIPVIVAIPGHVITVIGHSYAAKSNGLGVTNSAAEYIDQFIAHDDERGPYQRMKVGIHKEKGYPEQLTLDKHPVQWCLVPMPGRVHLLESDVRVMAKQWLDELASLSGEPGYWKKSDFRDLSTRCYLRRSDQFKMDIFPSDQDLRWTLPQLAWRSPELVAYYWTMPLPRYIWVVELAKVSEAAWHDFTKQRIVGEMIFDSTSHVADPHRSLIAVHLNGKLVYANKNDDELSFVQSLPRSRYSPLVRIHQNS